MDSSKNICSVCGGQTRERIRENRPVGCGDPGYILVKKCEKCGQENILYPPRPSFCQAKKIQGVFC